MHPSKDLSVGQDTASIDTDGLSNRKKKKEALLQSDRRLAMLPADAVEFENCQCN